MTTPAPHEDATWTIAGIEEMLGLSRRSIAGLIDSGYVSPRRGTRREFRFTFRDVVLLRAAADLQAARIPLRKIVAALKKLRATLPAELPLSGLRITAVGSDVTVRDAGSTWAAETGQLVFDFDLAPAGARVTFLPHARSADADAGVWFARGQALEASDAREAEAAYRRAIAIDPDHADAYLNLGALLCESDRCAEATRLYDEVLARHPREALLHFNRAVALEDLGRAEDALLAYAESLRLDAGLADAHYNAARLHEALGDAKSAVRHLSAYRRLQRR